MLDPWPQGEKCILCPLTAQFGLLLPVLLRHPAAWLQSQVVGMAGNEARSFHKATRTIQHTAFDVATPRFFRLESELVQLHAVDVLVPE